MVFHACGLVVRGARVQLLELWSAGGGTSGPSKKHLFSKGDFVQLV